MSKTKDGAGETWNTERRAARRESLNLEQERRVNARRDKQKWTEVDAMAEEEAERKKQLSARNKLNDNNFGARVGPPPEDGWDWF